MLQAQRIKSRFGDNICRSCINETYHVHLAQGDCRYGYMYSCPCCGKRKNIVVDFTAGGKFKTLLRF